MGRDIPLSKSLKVLQSFNPRARMGRDLAMMLIILFLLLFQPTRPHGARRLILLLLLR